MEIERVEVLALRQRLREPLGNAQRWESSRAALLVKVTTSKGLVGWGECHGSPELCAPIVNDFLGPRVIGQDPLKTAVLWENLYQRGREYGRQGLFLSALSGLDLALWDLKGKALGVSVATLLGGARGPQLEAYASGLYFSRGGNLAERLAEQAGAAVADGFKALALKVGLGGEADFANIRAVREAVGPEARLAIEADGGFTTRQAIELGRLAAGERLWWFADPVAPEDWDGCAEVRSALAPHGVAIAGGQAEATRYGFGELCKRRCLDYLQPHLTAAGGFTAGQQIAAVASAHGLGLRPRAQGSAVALAAALQFLAAQADEAACPAGRARWLEWEQTLAPLRDQLVEGFPQRDGAQVAVPEGPGLGIEVDEARCEAFR